MSLVQTLEVALADRVAELEQAEAKVASCEASLQERESALASTNGDFELFANARLQRDHAEHLLKRARDTVEHCRDNVACATSALGRARKQAQVALLQSTRVENLERMRAVALDAAAHYRAAMNAVAELQPLQVQEDSAFGQLRALGELPQRIHALGQLWLAQMESCEFMMPSCWQRLEQLEREDFAKNAHEILRLEPARYMSLSAMQTVQHLRRRFVVALPEPEPELEVMPQRSSQLAAAAQDL